MKIVTFIYSINYYTTMVEIGTMLQSHKDLIAERDKKIQDATKEIKDEYDKKLEEHKKSLHRELDAQIKSLQARGLS